MKPPSIRIMLDPEQSELLTDLGADAFIVIAKDKSDARSGRWILHLLPCTYKAANDAVRVAQGISKARPIKPTTKP